MDKMVKSILDMFAKELKLARELKFTAGFSDTQPPNSGQSNSTSAHTRETLVNRDDGDR